MSYIIKHRIEFVFKNFRNKLKLKSFKISTYDTPGKLGNGNASLKSTLSGLKQTPSRHDSPLLHNGEHPHKN